MGVEDLTYPASASSAETEREVRFKEISFSGFIKISLALNLLMIRPSIGVTVPNDPSAIFPKLWDQAQRSGQQATSTIAKKSTFRDAEMEWMRTHADELRKLEGNWVVIEGSELVAYSSDFHEAFQKAKSGGVDIPFISYIPTLDEEPLMGI